MDNWYQKTVISQYAQSTALLALIEGFNDAIDPYDYFDSLYDKLWNIDTAVGYGLDVLGRIVGVSRIVTLPEAPGDDYFGFQIDGSIGTGLEPFNQAPFYAGPLNQNYALTDSDFRVLILVKALANISDCSIPTLNKILMTLFPNRGNAYVTDDGGMHMTLTFEFALAPVEITILQQTGVFSGPAGVEIAINSA